MTHRFPSASSSGSFPRATAHANASRRDDELPPTLRSDGSEQPIELAAWFDRHLNLALRVAYLEQDDMASGAAMPGPWRTARFALEALKDALYDLYRAARDPRASALLEPTGATLQCVGRLYVWADTVADLLDAARASRTMAVPYTMVHADEALSYPLERCQEWMDRVLDDIARAVPRAERDGDLAQRLKVAAEEVFSFALVLQRDVLGAFDA